MNPTCRFLIFSGQSAFIRMSLEYLALLEDTPDAHFIGTFSEWTKREQHSREATCPGTRELIFNPLVGLGGWAQRSAKKMKKKQIIAMGGGGSS